MYRWVYLELQALLTLQKKKNLCEFEHLNIHELNINIHLFLQSTELLKDTQEILTQIR